MKKKEKLSDEARWEQAATLFEDPKHMIQIAKGSRLLTPTEERAWFGPKKTKQISIRIPDLDLKAVKNLAKEIDRPYQQLIVLAIQHYLDRVSLEIKSKTTKNEKTRKAG